jgi:hypothetical protein
LHCNKLFIAINHKLQAQGWLDQWKQNNLSPDAFVVLPNGVVKINLTLSREQVDGFFTLLQKLTVVDLVGNSILFILVLIFVMLLVNALIKERKGRRKLALAHEQLYQYSLQAERGTGLERIQAKVPVNFSSLIIP